MFHGHTGAEADLARLLSGDGTGSIDKLISRAIGEELRRTREAHGWSRAEFVARLPSGIGDRTLLSYEHGSRHLSVLRLIELCYELLVDMPSLMRRALQRAHIRLERVVMEIDLRVLLNDRNPKFRPMAQWARNTLNQHPEGTVEVEPAVVRHLAWCHGYQHDELAKYLARFLPDDPSLRSEES
jgi:transcriptional regulator with XRE-family HTH domain